MDDRVIGHHRHGHVRGVGRDAGVARAQDREHPVRSPDRRSSREPGSRLLQGVATLRKYTQRVRCSRLPAVVAALRSWVEAPARMACGKRRIARPHDADGAQGRCSWRWRRSAGRRRPARSMRVEPEAVDVDDAVGQLHPELHEVDEGRSAGEEAHAGALLGRRRAAAAAMAAERSAARVRLKDCMVSAPPIQRGEPAGSPRRCSDRRRSDRCCRS